MKRFPHIFFPIHLMSEVNIYDKQLFLRVGRRIVHPCESHCLCDLCGELIF